MTRPIAAFCLLPLLLFSAGCRVCNTPYDYCIPAYIDRPDDFRDCGPMYRAGSAVDGGGVGIAQAAYYEEVDIYNNAGNYGMTTPIASAIIPADPATTQRHRDLRIAIPPQDIDDWNWGTEPGNRIPSVRELLDRPRRAAPMPMPIIPPGRSPYFDDKEDGETIHPFTPSDGVVPLPNTFPATPIDSPITLEELRRLDPTVSDVQIISIEDADDSLFR